MRYAHAAYFVSILHPDYLDLLFLTHGHPPNRQSASPLSPCALPQTMLIADISTGIRRAGGGVAHLVFGQPFEHHVFGGLKGNFLTIDTPR